MTTKVMGYDEKGKKIWERQARDYDKGITGQIVSGLTIGDLLKFAGVLVACVAWYFSQQTSWTNQQNLNSQTIITLQKIGDQVEKHSKILSHLDTYLSSSTGKQFTDGEPIR